MKTCFITGTRAEYGLLKPLIDELKADTSFKVQIIATGMHLSPEFGLTFTDIENDGFKIDEKVEILLSSDTSIGISKAMGLAMISFSEVYQRLKPDLIVGLGDRFELFSAVSAAMVAGIPVAHIHGGELTEGAFDDAFRHAITKMAHLHFTSTEVYQNRVLQLGEDPAYVFNSGALGLDNIKKLQLLPLKELEKSISFSLNQPFFVVTFHPATLQGNVSGKQFSELLKALDNFRSHKVIFTKPNADSYGRSIIKLIDQYVADNSDRCISFNSLGQLRYLSALKYCKAMIGNSSSGILEMPFFSKPTVNIGTRQKGRIFSDSVLQCEPEKDNIIKAIDDALSDEFKTRCSKQPLIYGDGTAALKIKNVLKNIDLNEIIIKSFNDIRINKKN